MKEIKPSQAREVTGGKVPARPDDIETGEAASPAEFEPDFGPLVAPEPEIRRPA